MAITRCTFRHRCLRSALCGVLIAMAFSPALRAQDGSEEASEANWLTQQIRRFRSHPHLDRAYRLEQSGRLKEARAELAKAVAADPGNQQARIDYLTLLERLKAPEEVLLHSEPLLKIPDRRAYALLMRARAYRSLNRFEEARADLKLVVGTSDAEREVRRFAADALVDLELKEGRYQEALDALALLPDAGDFRAHLRRGMANDALKRYTEAAEHYGAALKAATDSSERVQALEYIGNNALKRQAWERARSAFDEALSLDPRNTRLMRALVDAAYRAGHPKQALRWAGEVMTLEPTPAYKEVLGNLRFATGDYTGAVGEYEDVLKTVKDADDRARILAAAGYAYFAMQRYAEAVKSFDQSAQLRSDPKIREALDMARKAAQPPQNEMQSLEETVAKRPTAQARMRLGALYLERGDEDAALRQFGQVAEARGTDALRANAYRRLWPAYYARGDQAAARTALEQLVALAPDDAKALRALAHINIEEGDTAAAIARLRRSVAIAPDVEAYRALAYALALTANWPDAIAANRALLKLPDLPAAERAEAYEKIARAQIELGDHAGATTTLQDALNLGIDNAFIRERLGLALFGAHRWQEALAQFRQLYERDASAMAALYLSRCYSALKKTGLAIHYGRLAFGRIDELPASDQTQLPAELAYLYAEESEFAAAAEMWGRALARNPDPLTTFHYAVAKYRAGDVPEARKAWASIADGVLPPEQESERLHQLAGIRAAEGDLGEAIDLYRRADAIKPSAERQYRIGLALQELGRNDEATQAFEAAYGREVRADYALALGYAYVHAGRHADGARILEAASKLDPGRLSLYQDVAYAYLHAFQNDKAIEWFKRGIDARLAQREQREQRAQPPVAVQPSPREPKGVAEEQRAPAAPAPDVGASLRIGAPEWDRVVDLYGARRWFTKTSLSEAPRTPAFAPAFANAAAALAQSAPAAAGLPRHADPELERMRDEVRRLEKDWNFTLYQAYSPAQRRTDAGVASTGGAVVPSQGGLEISYRPPVVGFRDERIFDIYVRALWSNQPRSLDIESESLQGGIGLRYKPFQGTQFYVSGERLFKIGDNAQNTWLFRASYGWTDIADSKFNETNWNYTSFYADAGYFTDDDHTRAFYSEARQGRTFKLSDRWLLTPHLVLNGRYEQPNFSPGSYWQAGAGASIKYLFNATRYSSYRSSVEVLAHYKVGLAHVASGWLLTLVVRL